MIEAGGAPMAAYTRFELLLPVSYIVPETDPATGEERQVHHSLSNRVLNPFLRAIQRRYHGVTQANPVAPAMYRGYWQARAGTSVTIDHLTYVFALVAIDETPEALSFFASWKQRLEVSLHQTEILITYYTVHTIGDFL